MKIPLFKVFMAPDIGKSISKLLESGYVGQGAVVDQFESDLQSFLNCDNLLTLNSCTSALTLALHLIKTGSEVLTTPLTCFATTAAILNNGLKPKWVDVDPSTCNMDLNDLETKLSRKTKIVMVVHFAGNPVDMDRLDRILDKCEYKYGYKPLVIEDCAHSFGSTVNSNNIACYSFQAIKILTTVDGGAIRLPDVALYNRAKLLRWYGMDRTINKESQLVKECGFKYHMNDLNATIGVQNLKHVQGLIDKQRKIYALYQKELKDISLSYMGEGNGWLYPVLVNRKEDFERKLAEKGIEASQPHPRNDSYHCVSEYKVILPGMDIIDQEMTCIPCGWWLTEEDTNLIIETIKKGW